MMMMIPKCIVRESNAHATIERTNERTNERITL